VNLASKEVQKRIDVLDARDDDCGLAKVRKRRKKGSP